MLLEEEEIELQRTQEVKEGKYFRHRHCACKGPVVGGSRDCVKSRKKVSVARVQRQGETWLRKKDYLTR